MNAVRRDPKLTVLSFGGGQDSTQILYETVFDSAFRAEYAPNELVAVFADTLDEHDDTYSHLDYVATLCRSFGIEFVRVTPDMGFHGTGEWAKGLTGFYAATDTVGSKCFRKTCTDNLKIKPIYRWLAKRLADRYGTPLDGKRWRGKQPIVEFAEAFGKIRVLIGFARGEEGRVADDASLPPWMRAAVERTFPLIERGWDRADCVRLMQERGLPVPPPSLCRHCPYKDEVELLWTARRLPAVYAEWVELEAAKVRKFAARGVEADKNFGVFGRRPLPVVLAAAEVKHGHRSDAELDAYRMSHGHCVTSRY